MEKVLSERIESLREMTGRHLDVTRTMLEAYGGSIYYVDLLAAAVLNRSVRLINGFADLIPKNLMSAAPLVRLQLDNYLRFGATAIVSDPHRFVSEVLRGVPVRKLKDYKGRQMTDALLVEVAAEMEPGIRHIYEKGCEYVHLCDTHILHAVRPDIDDALGIHVGLEETEVSIENRIDAAETMATVTDLLLRLINNWTYTKSNPPMATDPIGFAKSLISANKVAEGKALLENMIKFHQNPDVVAEAERLIAAS